MKLVEVVRSVAERHHCSPAQIALAWLLAQGDFIVPIPGSKRRATLEDSMAAVNIALTETDLDELESAAPLVASGHRPSVMRREPGRCNGP